MIKNIVVISLLIAATIIINPLKLNAVTVPDGEPLVKCNTSMEIKTYARCMVNEKWDDTHWESFNSIVNKESWYWKVTTDHNPDLSSAYGLGGFLDATWSIVGCVKTDDVYIQIDCMIKYIEMRPKYGTPKKAWEFHQANNWY